jgi:hypothetical protein
VAEYAKARQLGKLVYSWMRRRVNWQINFFGTSLPMYQTRWCHIPENKIFHIHCREDKQNVNSTGTISIPKGRKNMAVFRDETI